MTRRELLVIAAALSAGGAFLAAEAAVLSRGWRIGRVSRVLSLGYGSCLRCLTTWRFVDPHSTRFLYCAGDPAVETPAGGRASVASGCFPLCEGCWAELTPAERLPFYRQLHDRWAADGSLGPGFPWETWVRSVVAEENELDHSRGRTWVDPDGVRHWTNSPLRTSPDDPGPKNRACGEPV